MSRLLFVLLALATLSGVGCGTVSKMRERYEAPTTALAGAVIRGVQLMESEVQFYVRYENENDKPLVIEGAVHKIYVNGKYVGKAMGNRPVALPAFGYASQDAIAHLSNLKLATQLSDVFARGGYAYEIRSTMHATTQGGHSRRFTNTGTGTVEFMNAPQSAPTPASAPAGTRMVPAIAIPR